MDGDRFEQIRKFFRDKAPERNSSNLADEGNLANICHFIRNKFFTPINEQGRLVAEDIAVAYAKARLFGSTSMATISLSLPETEDLEKAMDRICRAVSSFNLMNSSDLLELTGRPASSLKPNLRQEDDPFPVLVMCLRAMAPSDKFREERKNLDLLIKAFASMLITLEKQEELEPHRGPPPPPRRVR